MYWIWGDNMDFLSLAMSILCFLTAADNCNLVHSSTSSTHLFGHHVCLVLGIIPYWLALASVDLVLLFLCMHPKYCSFFLLRILMNRISVYKLSVKPLHWFSFLFCLLLAEFISRLYIMPGNCKWCFWACATFSCQACKFPKLWWAGLLVMGDLSIL